MKDRYERQRLLREIGDRGQERLLSSSVTIIGCGALGCAQAQLLVRAGVGSLRVVDRDVVELGNLHRQIIFDEQDVAEGLPKAEAAAGKLRLMNRDVRIEPVVLDVNADNVRDVIGEPDLVLDATDNTETRYLMNEACVEKGTPWIYGGVLGTEGLMLPVLPGRGPCLRCLFPEAPPPGAVPTCESMGVINTAPVLVAALQATMAVRMLVGSPPEPRLTIVDLWAPEMRQIEIEREPSCVCCG